MTKKGFTIVEILGIILVLSVIMALVIPILTNTSSRAKNKLYETKINMIEKAAILYAQDNYNALVEGSNNPTVTNIITVDFLIQKKYIVGDKITDEGEVLIDPRTNKKIEVNIEITINTLNKKISAKVLN